MDKLNTMFRDFKVAEDVAKMMEMRRFEVEYTMYGSLLRREGQKCYLISDEASRVISFGQQREHFDDYPFPMITHTKMTTVPAGSEEDIAWLVKAELAKIIASRYPDEFLQRFYQLADTAANDAAEPLLSPLAERMHGYYQADDLLLFQGLMDLALRRKNLTQGTCAQYIAWLEQQRQEMADDPVWQDKFSKTLYGFCTREQNGSIKAYYNAEESKIYQKKAQLEDQGFLVTNVLADTCWYNYDKTLADARTEFGQRLLYLLDDTYFTCLTELQQLPPAVDAKVFQQLYADCQNYGSSAAEAMKQYGQYWGMTV